MNKINVVFVADAKSIDKCIVSMLSVLQNKSSNDYIKFYFIADEFFDNHLFNKFNCLKSSSSEVSVLSVKSHNYDILRLSTNRCDLPNNAYYRLSIADLLEKETKAIYIDFDVFVNQSLNDLFNIDIEDYYLAAVRDIWEEKRMFELMQVGIKTNFHYNSGMMLLNLSKWRKENIFAKLVNYAQNNPHKFVLADQFLINSVLNKNVLLLDYKYNLQISQHNEPVEYKDLENYSKSICDAVIIHFIFGKPWEFSKCRHPLRDKWWMVARSYPYYEELLFCIFEANTNINIIKVAKYTKNKLRYWRYKLLSKITFGELRKHYKRKKKDLKQRLRQVKKFLKSK